MILAVDLGSTSWKAAAVDVAGMQAICRIPAPFEPGEDGSAQVEADAFADALCTLLSQLPQDARVQATAIALTGMAEGGVLLDADTLQPLTAVSPWYDRKSVPVAEVMATFMDTQARHAITGLPVSYKYGVFRALQAIQTTGRSAQTVRWSGVVDYAALLLTSARYQDASLAARTYAWDLQSSTWDTPWLASVGLSGEMFAPLIPAGTPGGSLTAGAAGATGLPPGLPVYVCGHDHVCAAYGAGIEAPGHIYGSMGTAQVLLGIAPGSAPAPDQTQSGLSFGPFVRPDLHTVLGSIQAAGGSVNWAQQALFGGQAFEEILPGMVRLPPGPSGLLYYPYLSGSGAPHLDAAARGSFIGLSLDTTPTQMLLAIYEGIAMESRLILEAAGLSEAAMLTVAGGLTAHPRLMQVLADVLSMDIAISDEAEGSLYGAARLASQGTPIRPAGAQRVVQTSRYAGQYGHIYKEGYLPLIAPMGKAFAALKGERTT